MAMSVVDEPFVGLGVALLEHGVWDLIDDVEGFFDGCPDLIFVVVFEVEVVNAVVSVVAIRELETTRGSSFLRGWGGIGRGPWNGKDSWCEMERG